MYTSYVLINIQVSFFLPKNILLGNLLLLSVAICVEICNAIIGSLDS